jgi:lipopolysaccharide/colanic/teichoic acid biosynthesis glycosyltransferase
MMVVELVALRLAGIPRRSCIERSIFVNHDTLSNSLLLPPFVPSSQGGLARARALVRRARLLLRIELHDARTLARRLLAIVVTAVALLVAAPLLILAAAGIKLTSPGPVLFRQERIGKNGRRFMILKLRTMVTNAESMKARLAEGAEQNIRFKMRRDPRITPLGRILRKYSIDELPQLWNVLMGEMALIGPRPPLWSEVAKYDAYALRRLEVTQGLTCFWQIAGRSDIPFEEQVKLDINYIDRSGPVDEFRILAMTIPAVLSGRGSY